MPPPPLIQIGGSWTSNILGASKWVLRRPPLWIPSFRCRDPSFRGWGDGVSLRPALLGSIPPSHGALGEVKGTAGDLVQDIRRGTHRPWFPIIIVVFGPIIIPAPFPLDVVTPPTFPCPPPPKPRNTHPFVDWSTVVKISMIRQVRVRPDPNRYPPRVPPLTTS